MEQTYTISFSFLLVLVVIFFTAGFASSLFLSLFLAVREAYISAFLLATVFMAIIIADKLLILGFINGQQLLISTIYITELAVSMVAGVFMGGYARINVARFVKKINKIPSRRENIKWAAVFIIIFALAYDIYYMFLQQRP